MICIKTDIPQEICDIDDELKATYHGKDTVCIWVANTSKDWDGICILVLPVIGSELSKCFVSANDTIFFPVLPLDNCIIDPAEATDVPLSDVAVTVYVYPSSSGAISS